MDNNVNYSNLKIFAGSASKNLARDIAKELNVSVANCTIKQFLDGEFALENRDNVYGNDVYIVQSTCKPVNDNLMELLMFARSAKTSGASRLTAVIPYFGYARQDRKIDSRDVITAKLVADMIDNVGFDQVLLMDLHAQQIQGFFNQNKLVHGITGRYIIEDYFREIMEKKQGDEFIVVSPDAGSFKDAYKLKEALGVNLATIDKNRKKVNETEVIGFLGDVKGKIVFMRDDMIDTAGTICNAAKVCAENGAKEIYVATTHGVFSGNAIEKISNSYITSLVMLDTIELEEEKQIDKIKVLSTAKLFAQNIQKMYLKQDLNGY